MRRSDSGARRRLLCGWTVPGAKGRAFSLRSGRGRRVLSRGAGRNRLASGFRAGFLRRLIGQRLAQALEHQIHLVGSNDRSGISRRSAGGGVRTWLGLEQHQTESHGHKREVSFQEQLELRF